MCFSFPGQRDAKCACAIGDLDLSSNGGARTCKTPKEYLIYAMETEIRSVNLRGGDSMPWKPITGFSKAVGIDFDYRDKKILFSDLADRKIGSFLVEQNENTRVEDVLVRNGSRSLVSMPEGIAYDWISDTVYFADNSLNQVVSYKISTRMSYVISYSESPRAVVVHPCKGYVFWTDVGRQPMIARASLAGSNFVKVISTNIKWPNGLTIDFEEDKLYWADAYFDKIESSNLEGNFRQVLTTAYHPFAITLHNHYIVC